jgi:predicted metal-binding membrane protein
MTVLAVPTDGLVRPRWFATRRQGVVRLGAGVTASYLRAAHERAHPESPEAAGPRRPLLYVLVGATSLFAYLALWVGSRSPWARYLDHALVTREAGATLSSVLFVVAWTGMVTAMMLPTAVPLFEAFGRVVRRRPQRRRLLLTLVGGYLGVWAAFGYVLVWTDLAVHAVVDRLPVLADRPKLVAGTVLLAAGLYQFSDLKRQCLTRCRSPLSLIVPRWSGTGGDALRIGLDYGVSCLGCCWTLMLLLFAVGMGNVGVMLALGAFMAVEKNVPRARRLTPSLGVLLVGAGVAIAVSTLI